MTTSGIYGVCDPASHRLAHRCTCSWDASMVATSTHPDIRRMAECGTRFRGIEYGDEWIVEVLRKDHGTWCRVGFLTYSEG